jgi:hypothetical protein
MADSKLSSKDAGQSSAEANRLSKGAGRSSRTAERSSADMFRHADADVSVTMPHALIRASEPTGELRLASRMRPAGGPDPSGASSRKISG